MAHPYWLVCLFLALCFSGVGSGLAQDQAAAIEALKREMQELRRAVNDKQKKIDNLERKVEALQKSAVAAPQPALAEPVAAKTATAQEALDQAVEAVAPKETPTVKEPLLSKKIGKAEIKLLDISADLMVATGTSTATDHQLQSLQGGAHDPKKRGFTLQQMELGLAGAVDPYFNAQAYMVWSVNPITNESIVELEEAYFTTQKLPLRLQLKGGYFLTEFGRINPTHPHAWLWLDQPVINTRLFGPDGLRSAGARMSWLAPLPWYSRFYVGMQNANNLTSFLGGEEETDEHGHAHGGPIGGRPTIDRATAKLGDFLYLARWENSLNLGPAVTSQLGFSGLYGPNSTGTSGNTWIYGADLVMKWRPGTGPRGWPFLIWESEIMKRDFLAGSFSTPGDPDAGVPPIYLPKATLRDWGLYTQLYWGFHPGWAVGLRYEWATGSGRNVHVHADEGELEFIRRSTDPLRGNRSRLSPLLAWYPSEFSRIRLQYNYDWAAFRHPNNSHTFWVGFELLYGAHPAHKF